MATKRATRKIAGTAADPTLPKTPIVIGGKTYDLCFDLGALAEAETAINAELARAGSPERVNLLAALPVPNLVNTRLLFAAAVRKFHPEIPFRAAMEIPALEDLYNVSALVAESWSASMPAPAENPPQPGA